MSPNKAQFRTGARLDGRRRETIREFQIRQPDRPMGSLLQQDDIGFEVGFNAQVGPADQDPNVGVRRGQFGGDRSAEPP